MTIDSVIFASTGWSPFTYWQQPFEPTFEGEAGYVESDMPGLSTSRTAYTALGAQRYDDTVVAMPCGLQYRNDKTSRWANVAHGCAAFDIYTKDGA